LRLRDRLPLHLAGLICAASLQRRNMVNHIARARAGGLGGRRAGILSLELVLRGRAAGDPAAAIPCTGRAFPRGASRNGGGAEKERDEQSENDTVHVTRL